jgi:hypothetical protein
MKTFPILLCHPNIPKPLHTLNPRTIKGNKWWKQTKKECKAKFNDHCWACGVHKSKAKMRSWLEAHESYNINYSTGRVEYVGTCALCHPCHNFIHNGRLINLINKNGYSYQNFEQIMNHGNAILKPFIQSLGIEWTGGKKWHWEKDDDGFSYLEKSNQLIDDYPVLRTHSKQVQWIGDDTAEWHEYHLILDNQKYDRKFATKEDWEAFYQ